MVYSASRWCPKMADLPQNAAVVIVGSGPAGLAAATLLAEAGVRPVIVLDRVPTPGGVPRHCAHSPYGLREFRRLMTGPAYARALVARAKAAGVTIHTGVNVTQLLPGPEVAVTSDAGPSRIAARLVMLATGARESTRAQRMIGGTKPAGVLSTGALQALIHEDGLIPFRRPVILGTELVSFSAILTCRLAGIRPVAMIEETGRTTARKPSGLLPFALGIPLLTGTSVAEIEGRDRVTGIRLAGAHADRLGADGLVVTGRFRPEAALLPQSHLVRDPGTGGPEVDQFGRCSDPCYFASGNLLRPVETAGWGWAEGRSVGKAMLRTLKGTLAPDPGLRIRSSGVSALVPQRIAPGTDPALDRLQIRVAVPSRGRLSLQVDGSEVAGRDLRALPERRIVLPLPRPGALQIDVSLAQDQQEGP